MLFWEECGRHVPKLGENRATGIIATVDTLKSTSSVLGGRKFAKDIAEEVVGKILADVHLLNGAILAQFAIHINVELQRKRKHQQCKWRTCHGKMDKRERKKKKKKVFPQSDENAPRQRDDTLRQDPWWHALSPVDRDWKTAEFCFRSASCAAANSARRADRRLWITHATNQSSKSSTNANTHRFSSKMDN